MSSLDLPNEILGSVINYVDPGDLDNFAESSPLLKCLATPALEVHHERKQEYTNIELYGCYDHRDHHPLQLLEQICANPQVAWYPRSLKVTCCGGWPVDEYFVPLMNDKESDKKFEPEYFNGVFSESDVINVDRVIKAWAEGIRDLVFHSGYFDEEESECWYNQIRKGNRQAVVGLLLTLLPNLETIEFQAYNTRVDLLVEIVHRITGPPRESSKKTKEGARALTSLRKLRLRGWEDFGIVECFARLPSMRKIRAFDFNCRLSDRSGRPWTRIESGSSNIDEIRIAHAYVSSLTLVECLRCLKALRNFHYNYDRGHGGNLRPSREDLGSILAVIIERFKSSLKSLSLRGWDHVRLTGSIDTSISLDSFKKLTRASLPFQLLASVPKEQPQASSPVGDGADPQISDLSTFSRLVDILPRSMEELTLSGPIKIQVIETLLSGLVSQKPERLPRLSKIIFSSFIENHGPSRATATALQSQCREVGIELDLKDRH